MALHLQSLYRHYESNQGYNNRNMDTERHIIYTTKNKVQSNKALITKADSDQLSTRLSQQN